MARSTAAFAFPAVAAGLLAAAVYVRMRFLRKLAHIPGPPYTFLLGNLAQLKGPPAFPFAFFTQRHLFLRALHARYGPVVRIVLPAGRGALVFFAEAEPMVEPFFQNAAVFSRRPSSPKVMELGLLAVPTGDLSRMHRAALSPAFSTRALRHHAFTLNRHASELCAYLLAASGGGTSDVEIHKPLCATTMDVIGEVGFGARFDCLASEASGGSQPFLAASNLMLSGVLAFVPLPLPVTRLVRSLPLRWQPPSQRLMFDGMRTYQDAARKLLSQHRKGAASATPAGSVINADDTAAGPPPPATFLEALAHGPLSEEEAVDEVLTLLLAGHETTANTLCWALHLLATHPREQARALAELRAACPGSSPLELATLASLPYLRGCFYEALRLFPTVPNVPRIADSDITLNGVRVPAGCLVFYTIAVGARDPSVFAEPERFAPERHGEVADSSALPWLPFGGGPRKCIGYRFAELEAVAFLAAVLRAFEVCPPEEHTEPPGEYTDITLGPKQSGLYVRLRPRTG